MSTNLPAFTTSSAIPEPLEPRGKYVKFSVDAELLRELGERLVGKPHVALGELVKNAYDADATRCVIRFGEDAIEVADDGSGMSYVDFVDKWMRIGSTHKREQRISHRFSRPLTGSKGIGRLSAQFLGDSIEVISEPTSAPRDAIEATVNWADAVAKGSLVEAGAYIKAKAGADLLPHAFKHGTCIRIRKLKDVWTPHLLQELAAELWFLQPPAAVAGDVSRAERFNIELEGVDEPSLRSFREQLTAALGNWIARLEGNLEDGREEGKARIKLTFSDGETHQASYPLLNRALDEAKFEILIFKLAGRQAGGISVTEAREYFKRFGGVHIYDSGFRLPFYGGGEQDWLNLEIDHSHRLMQSQLVPERVRPESGNLNDLPTLGRVFGIVTASTAHESEAAPDGTSPSQLLTMQVTRDRLIDNLAYEDLRYFVRWALDFYSYWSTSRRAKLAARQLSRPRDEEEYDVRLATVHQLVGELKAKTQPNLVEPLEKALERFEDIETRRRQEADAERVLMGALATAGMASVALQHELSKELATLEDVVRKLEAELPEGAGSDVNQVLATLHSWVETASQTRRMFSPFFDAEDRDRMKKMRVKRVLERLSSNLFPLMRGTKVETEDIPDDIYLPRGTLAGWNAVFQNIFINAVNAMLESRIRRVRCRAFVDGRGKARLIVEDTGVGVDPEESEELFEPFVRKLDLPEDRRALGLGGVGIGLTIVRMVCRTFGCDVRFVRPKAPFKTAIELAWEHSNNG